MQSRPSNGPSTWYDFPCPFSVLYAYLFLQVLGGFHLGGPEVAHTIAPTVKFMAESMRPSPTYVLPMHCTGFDAKVALKEALGEGCVPAGAGMNVMVKGDPEGEKMMMVPTIV